MEKYDKNVMLEKNLIKMELYIEQCRMIWFHSMYMLYRSKKIQERWKGEPLLLSQLTGEGGKDPNKKTAKNCVVGLFLYFPFNEILQ